MTQINTTPNAGGSPAAGDFLLSRQKKVTKENATPVRRPSASSGSPAFLSQTGRYVTRAARSNSARFTSPALASSLGGSQGEVKLRTTGNYFDSAIAPISQTQIIFEAIKISFSAFSVPQKNSDFDRFESYLDAEMAILDVANNYPMNNSFVDCLAEVTE